MCWCSRSEVAQKENLTWRNDAILMKLMREPLLENWIRLNDKSESRGASRLSSNVYLLYVTFSLERVAASCLMWAHELMSHPRCECTESEELREIRNDRECKFSEIPCRWWNSSMGSSRSRFDELAALWNSSAVILSWLALCGTTICFMVIRLDSRPENWNNFTVRSFVEILFLQKFNLRTLIHVSLSFSLSWVLIKFLIPQHIWINFGSSKSVSLLVLWSVRVSSRGDRLSWFSIYFRA